MRKIAYCIKLIKITLINLILKKFYDEVNKLQILKKKKDEIYQQYCIFILYNFKYIKIFLLIFLIVTSKKFMLVNNKNKGYSKFLLCKKKNTEFLYYIYVFNFN